MTTTNMAIPTPDVPDPLLEGAIPETPPRPTFEKPDLSEPWYRPAKQYLRRVQWNADILRLLNLLPGSRPGEATTIRYVGLPGQHHFDVLSMGKICGAKNLRIDYLGFRSGGVSDAMVLNLRELQALSTFDHYTQNSVTVRDCVENIGLKNTLATNAFEERGPFDVVNLDVCGGILHGNTTPLLNAVKYVLSSQVQRNDPWLLFVTTTAKADDIEHAVITKFFSTVITNCDTVTEFKDELINVAAKIGISAEESLENPTGLQQDGFLRFFTLAFGKWLLANLAQNSPRATVTLQSVYSFRNKDRTEPEMLSLAYLISPVISGGADPSGLTNPGYPSPTKEYTDSSVGLIASSINGIKDLDHVWHQEPQLKRKIIEECEALLKAIGVDEIGLQGWMQQYGLNVAADA